MERCTRAERAMVSAKVGSLRRWQFLPTPTMKLRERRLPGDGRHLLASCVPSQRG
jgi:hypothetical protein